MKMALLYTLPSSTLLSIFVFFMFTSVISREMEPRRPTMSGSTIIPGPGIPQQPETPTLQVPPFLPVAPPSLPETPSFQIPPFLPVTPPSIPETPALNFPPFFPFAPPSAPETPTVNFPPFLPVTPPSVPETPTLPAPFLPVTPPSLPETPTLPAPFLPVTPPSLPQTPTPYQQAPTQPGPPTPKQDDKNACPKDVLKLGVCVDVLGRSIGPIIGSPPKLPCCKIMEGLLDLEAAVCLCSAIRANVLGTIFDFPIAISNVFNNCQKDLPSGFQCE